jgi:hypothetical protein
MNLILKKIYSNQLAFKVRNSLKIRPNIYITPTQNNAPVSDFFYWKNDEEYETQFALMNIGSHILPNIKQKDSITIFIYSNNGIFLKKLNFVLNDLECIKLNFSDYALKGYGSFFVFHKLENLDYLNANKTFVTERGYVGYRKNRSLWNYMHGNHNAAYLDSNNDIISLMPMSLFYNEYIPQSRFDDVEKFKLIFNNVNKKQIPLNLELYGINNKLIKILKYSCAQFNTIEIPIYEKNTQIKFIKIKSKLIFCRPIIFKDQKQDFDIYHG